MALLKHIIGCNVCKLCLVSEEGRALAVGSLFGGRLRLNEESFLTLCIPLFIDYDGPNRGPQVRMLTGLFHTCHMICFLLRLCGLLLFSTTKIIRIPAYKVLSHGYVVRNTLIKPSCIDLVVISSWPTGLRISFFIFIKLYSNLDSNFEFTVFDTLSKAQVINVVKFGEKYSLGLGEL